VAIWQIKYGYFHVFRGFKMKGKVAGAWQLPGFTSAALPICNDRERFLPRCRVILVPVNVQQNLKQMNKK
jgi:hypothetical protein